MIQSSPLGLGELAWWQPALKTFAASRKHFFSRCNSHKTLQVAQEILVSNIWSVIKGKLHKEEQNSQSPKNTDLWVLLCHKKRHMAISRELRVVSKIHWTPEQNDRKIFRKDCPQRATLVTCDLPLDKDN